MLSIFSSSYNTVTLHKQDVQACRSQERLARAAAHGLADILIRERLHRGDAPDSPTVVRLKQLGDLYAAEIEKRVTC
jgi:hypothetical protein